MAELLVWDIKEAHLHSVELVNLLGKGYKPFSVVGEASPFASYTYRPPTGPLVYLRKQIPFAEFQMEVEQPPANQQVSKEISHVE